MQLSVRAIAMTLLVSSWSAEGTNFDRPIISVGSTFHLPVRVNGSHSDVDTLVFDTGSPHTWIYHYRYLRQIPVHQGGGYPITGLRTRITAPAGANRLEYADNDVFHADVWTEKTFSVGNHSWLQPFGIVHEADQRGVIQGVTGLLGASRESHFTELHPLFSFKPTGARSMSFDTSQLNATEVCRERQMSYFPLGAARRLSRFWGSDVELRFGPMTLTGGMIFDTGSSVIALPSSVFGAFRRVLGRLSIAYNYRPQLLSGIMPCSRVNDLPSWKLNHETHPITITPSMYVRRVSFTQCVVQVCELSDGFPVIMGLPLLEHVVSEFDSMRNRVGICHPTVSFVNDLDASPGPRGSEHYDCPTCSGAPQATLRSFTWIVILAGIALTSW